MITKTGIHAVRALAALALLPDGSRLGSALLAEKIGAPPNYLGKLLQTLARHGIVESQKGSGGGFRLAREPHRIRLLDVLESIEQAPSRWDDCFLGQATCSPDDPCAVHDRWAPLRDDYIALLSDTTIADLTARNRTAAPTEED